MGMYQSLNHRKKLSARIKFSERMKSNSHENLYTARLYPSGAFSVGRRKPSKSEGLKDYFCGGDYDEWVDRRHESYMRQVRRRRIDEGHEVNKNYFPLPVVGPLPPIWEEGINRVICQAKRPPEGGLTNGSINAKENVEGGGGDDPLVDEPLPIDLTSLSYCRKVKKRRGLKGLTTAGKRAIREGGYLLTREYGKKRLGFYTCTCPYTDIELVHKFSANIGMIIKRYFERLKRVYKRMSLNFEYVCAIEIQPKRMNESSTVAMHIHYICVAKCIRGKSWVMTFDELRNIWHDCCFNVVQEPITSKVSVDGEAVKQDASAYLMKYVSKGDSDIKLAEEICPGVCPGRWYSLNNSLRRYIKTETCVIKSAVATDFFYFCKRQCENKELLFLCAPIYLEGYGPDGRFLVGFSGRFEKKCKEDLTEFWRTS